MNKPKKSAPHASEKHVAEKRASHERASAPPMTPREKELHDILNPPASATSGPTLAELKAAREQELHDKINVPEDKNYRPTIRTPLGRNPKADKSNV